MALARTRRGATRSTGRKIKELEFLQRSSRALNSTLDLDQVLNTIVRIVRDAMNVETASVLVMDADNKHMTFEVARGKRGRAIEGIRVPLTEGVVGWVARNQKPAVVNDLKKDKRNSPRLDKEIGLKTRSIMSIPLKRRHKLIGVLEAVNRRGKEPFTDDDLNLLLALGDHIATAIENARLFTETERRRLEHSMLNRIGVTLGKALTLDEVLDLILESLGQLIPYDAAAIFVLDPASQTLDAETHRGYSPSREHELRLKLDEGLVGYAASQKTGVIVGDVGDDARYVNARGRTRSEMITPMLSRGKVLGLFNLESNRRNAFTSDDLMLLETFAAQAGVSIERARLYDEQQTKRHLERELQLARTVQEFFTPRASRKLGPYTITGRNYPSRQLSGDYFDVFPLRKPYVMVAIGDVAGKGVPASIISSSFRATLHTAAPYYKSARDIALRANQILLETVRPEDFVTAFIGVMNPGRGTINYVNAGQNPPILMKPNGRYSLLNPGGTILGVLPDYDVDEETIELGDNLLFCYTDGTTDATNPKGTPFEIERLIKFLRAHRKLSPNKICTELRKHLKAFMDDEPPIDDLTFLVIKK